MHLKQLLATAAVTTIFALPAVQAEDHEAAADNPRSLLQEISEVTGKAGAMKRDLMEEVPEAQELRNEIRQLRERARELDKKLDALLADKNPEYAAAIKRKNELIEQYRQALRAEAQKARRKD